MQRAVEQPSDEQQGRSRRSAAHVLLPGVSGSVLAGPSDSFAPCKLGDDLSQGNANPEYMARFISRQI